LRTCYQMSIRRATQTLAAPRATLYYRSRQPEQAPLRHRIKEIATVRVRYGYRRIHTLLQREGWLVNHKRVYRLYCLEGLQMRHKPPRRRVSAKLREDRTEAVRPNQCRSPTEHQAILQKAGEIALQVAQPPGGLGGG
jgi:putative transposase